MPITFCAMVDRIRVFQSVNNLIPNVSSNLRKRMFAAGLMFGATISLAVDDYARQYLGSAPIEEYAAVVALAKDVADKRKANASDVISEIEQEIGCPINEASSAKVRSALKIAVRKLQ
ncbi:hypothetical protein [Azospirillum sp. sgz302134]